jgi:2-polyprenyl-3-methyl-5-hydroxy-6-metoxy-1,4-benzoquinol methylase/GT2 family glycosyltransferase
MNNGITILMVVNNGCEYTKLALKCICMFANGDNISVIVADNGSTDETLSSLESHTDINYIRVSETPLPVGKVINEVLNRVLLLGDLLILENSCMLTPGCIAELQHTLSENEKNAIVGAMSNTAEYSQKNTQFTDYGDAVKNVANLPKVSKPVLALEYGAILIKNQTIREIGIFDEQMYDIQYVLEDYCFRIILEGKAVQVCESAFVWDMCVSREEAMSAEHDYAVIEKKWGMRYFSMGFNEYLIPHIKEEPSAEFNVLEVGCDCGATLLEIKHRFPNAHIYGSEINERSAKIAACVANVCVNNIEEQNLPFDSVRFDYIIFGDVLEHLRNPLEALKYCSKLLNQGGHIIASIPNLMHISVIESLLNGNFTYTETGLLDKTHIHFFTFNEILRMFQKAELEIENILSKEDWMSESQKELIEQLGKMNLDSQQFMFQAFQYIVIAKKYEG